MHDLNTINRLNHERFGASIQQHLDAGRFVVAKYTGLSLVSYDTFADYASAERALHAGVGAAERLTLYTPRGHSAQPQVEKTLADIIANSN